MKHIRNSVITALIVTAASLLLSCVILLGYHAVYHYQVTDPSLVSRYTGDVNADFRISWEDVDAIQNLYRGGHICTQADTDCADLNHDGIVDNEDTAVLLRYLAEHDTWTLRGLEAYCQNQG